MKSKGVQNPKAILSNSKDEYLILPSCTEKEEYTLVINLSEDVAIDTIVMSNQEDFSDKLKEIEFQGSIEYPTEDWVFLGKAMVGFETVNVERHQMFRYLKIIMRGQEGNELYCTITSVR